MSKTSVRKTFDSQIYQQAAMTPREHAQRHSKLLELRDDYQRRLLRGREERLLRMMENQSLREQQRAHRVLHSGSVPADSTYPNSRLPQPIHTRNCSAPGSALSSSPSVRNFFRERREMETKGNYVPPINHHYKLAYSRYGSGNSYQKKSAGVDRARPLLPIQNRDNASNSAPSKPNPFSYKSHLIKRKTRSMVTYENENYKPTSQTPSQRHLPNPSRSNASHPQSYGEHPLPQGQSTKPAEPSSQQEDNADVQKQQMGQNKVREDRLRRLNQREPPPGLLSTDTSPSSKKKEEGDAGGVEDEELKLQELKRQEQELMARIAQEEATLEQIRREREEDEERGLQEEIAASRQEAVDREWQEEIAASRQEAVDREWQEEIAASQHEAVDREWQEEIAASRQEAVDRKWQEKIAASRQQAVDREWQEEAAARRQQAADREQRKRQQKEEQEHQRRQKEDERRLQAYAKQERQKASDATTCNNKHHATKAATMPRNKPPPHKPPPQRQPSSPPDDDEDLPVPGPGLDLYDQAVDNGPGGEIRLVPCKLCGRTFAEDRVQKHQQACKTIQKKRKVFDPTQMRTRNTEMAKYVSKGLHKKEQVA